MKAVVLAGGYATRLWPITRIRPKMLLPVGETTPLDRLLSSLEGDDRVDTVYVSTNERFAGRFRDHLASSRFRKPEVSVEQTTAETEKFGVVAALARLVAREGIDDDLLVVGGDNVFSFDLSAFVDHFLNHRAPCLAAYDVGSRAAAKEYGVVSLDGDRVTSFREKPDSPESSLVSVACYGLPASALSALETYLDEGKNSDEPGWFVQWLQARRPVYGFRFDGAWFDIGTPRSYIDAVAWALSGDTIVAEDATLDDATLAKNVHVMSGATVEDSHLRETVVFPDATVADCDLSRSIIDEKARVTALARCDAVVGAHSRIAASVRDDD